MEFPSFIPSPLLAIKNSLSLYRLDMATSPSLRSGPTQWVASDVKVMLLSHLPGGENTRQYP